ncbi:MBL fold metallo-hydrolase [Sphingomonas sp. S2-65]|uniref:MBL fold metallo-hydrolase n=1 Tax=Sphingomonas sp. S2-65 TaxID=2903960 RepID=UPI001F170FAB|nr:MBL fold metallo-hydrolase [Sphingomonas sp. S2-65]UYY57702.1 MBL fold metallo-hydrolase [Sphingomonas sp. S2-65]
MRVFKFVLAVLLWIVVAFCLAATVLPHFLDRIYYEGPESAHYDGARFFNPDGDDDRLRTPQGSGRFGFLARYLLGNDGRPVWPERVSVRESKPAPRVDGQAMRVTWVGHATLLVQTNGLNILTDPVWSDRAGPLGFGPTRVAAPGIRFDDLPRIDLVLVSHNHYDHMDLATLKRLWLRDRPLIVTSLGNDRVMAGAGVPARALDWGQSLEVRPGMRVAVTRNHHWGSRWFSDRNRALWSSFVVELAGGNFFFSGDTGLGDGKWPAEAAALGPIRLAAIPIGAFRFEEKQMAAGSHVGPLGALHIWQGLGQPQAIPIHWGTFRLSREGYDTPPRLLGAMQRCAGADSRRFAPVAIGRPVEIAPMGSPGPSPDFAKLDACVRAGQFDALR